MFMLFLLPVLSEVYLVQDVIILQKGHNEEQEHVPEEEREKFNVEAVRKRVETVQKREIKRISG
jgi:hypothetical protein